VRAEPAQARALLDTAGDLRRAHEAMIGGDADRDALKAAAAAERQAVNSLAATAAAKTTDGSPASADVERRIRDTLEAVALDPNVRERFAAGRLEKDARAAGLAMDVSTAGGKARPRKRRDDDQAKRKAERERQKLEDSVRRAEETVERRRRDAEAAEVARERANATLRESRKRLNEAEADLRRARRAAERHRASAPSQG
jgi:chromosome segregation ATPase